MKKIFYLALAMSVCTAGIVTAAHFTPITNNYDSNLTLAVDTIIPTEDDDDDFVEITEDEEDEDEFGEMHEESEDDEFGEMEVEDNGNDIASRDSLATDIDLTEGMMIDVDEQLSGWDAQHYLKDGEKQTQTSDVQTDAEEYVRRLKRIPAIIEMPYNDVVRKYIDQYTGRLRRSVSLMLGAQNFYNPMFEEALEAEGCPLELKYLPIIESALKPTATSRVGAAGLWQFMPATGKTYGLDVNSLVDDRRDPIKSSKAAAKYLKYLHKQLGDWTLAIAAYNCGPANIQKAIQRAGGSTDYWEIYPYLPNETRGYVPAFIAANYVMQFYCEHGIAPMESQLPEESDTIVISKDLHFQQIADLCNIDIKEIESLNPQYRQQIVPGYWKPCTLRLPNGTVSTFIAQGDSIYNHRISELLPRRSVAAVNTNYTPVVRSGNGNTKGSRYSSKSKSKGSRSVTIRPGDTLGAIARRNGTTVAKLKRLNGISGSNIRAGKKIRVR